MGNIGSPTLGLANSTGSLTPPPLGLFGVTNRLAAGPDRQGSIFRYGNIPPPQKKNKRIYIYSVHIYIWISEYLPDRNYF
jgi:hypothetical protein